jgi:hypothetical protein
MKKQSLNNNDRESEELKLKNSQTLLISDKNISPPKNMIIVTKKTHSNFLYLEIKS